MQSKKIFIFAPLSDFHLFIDILYLFYFFMQGKHDSVVHGRMSVPFWATKNFLQFLRRKSSVTARKGLLQNGMSTLEDMITLSQKIKKILRIFL
jgi:hypothetical protein